MYFENIYLFTNELFKLNLVVGVNAKLLQFLGFMEELTSLLLYVTNPSKGRGLWD